MAENKSINSCNEENVNSALDQRTLQPKKGINLLKRSKHDLLRLLSILEGELEARDIFISALQAQLSNQRNARQQYFVHRLNDPFLSLHRDDFTAGTSQNEDRRIPNELVHIEPLPLLEKVVYQFKSQQQKMHQHMSLASKIHRKMAHELAEEKRKHASDTKTGDDVTMELEKERERLKAGVLIEKERTKRLDNEYRKLLGLCKEEGRKHKMIVMTLLTEQDRLLQQLKQSKELQIDVDSTETELQARLHMALTEKQEIAIKLKHEQTQCSNLRSRMTTLQDHVLQLNSKKPTQNSTQHKSALEQATELYSAKIHDTEDEVTPELPLKMSRASPGCSENTTKSLRDSMPISPFAAMHHPMRIAQSSQDVTLIPTSSHPPILLADGAEGVTTSGYYIVKPGLSIAGLDAMKSAAQNKEMLNLEFSKDFLPKENLNHFGTIESSENEANSVSSLQNKQPQPPSVSVPPKPNRFIPGSPMYTPFRSPQSLFNERTYIASSPTSGASNFAMNSPNAPIPPNGSPFSITRPVKSDQKCETPVKPSAWASKPASSVRTPIKSPGNSQFQATRLKFQCTQSESDNGSTVLRDFEVNKFMKENITTENKSQPKKFSSVGFKSQKVAASGPSLPIVSKPAIAIKTETSNMNETEKMKPLPPKTRPSSAPSTITDQLRPPPLPPKKPNLTGDKPNKRTMSMSSVSETRKQESGGLGGLQQRKSQSVKKTTVSSPLTSSNKPNSLNQNDNNNGVTKRVKAPVPPLPLKMSSQQPTPPVAPRQPSSAQQRLFPSSDTDGPPLSPITHTAPKTPNVFFGTEIKTKGTL